MDLAVHDHRVDHVSAVIHRDVAEHGDSPGLGVDLNLGQVRPERKHVVWGVVRDLCPQSRLLVVRDRPGRHSIQRQASAWRPPDQRPPLFQQHVRFGCLQRSRSQPAQLPVQLVRRLEHG